MNMTLMLWTIGIFIMWIRSHKILRERGRKEVAGEHKAIFELAEAMRTQLISLGKDNVEDVPALGELDLRCRITKDLHGGSISYDYPQPPIRSIKDNISAGWRTKLKAKKEKWWTWTRKEKWWLTTFFISYVLCSTVGWYSFYPLWLFIISLPLAFVFALCYGSTKKSRGVLFLWSFLLLSLIFIPFWLAFTGYFWLPKYIAGDRFIHSFLQS